MNSELVYVYDTRTGEMRPDPVPRKWLTHSKHGQHISETPPAPAEGEPQHALTPVEVDTNTPAHGETPEED